MNVIDCCYLNFFMGQQVMMYMEMIICLDA